VDRLTPLDGSFLRVETRAAHMHVAWCGTFQPPSERQRPTGAALQAYLLGRLDRVPRFRQRLAFPPPGLGEPFWIDDPDFDIEAHVTALTEPDEPVTRRSFHRLTDALLSEPLDRRRPLWHLYLVPRLEDGGTGVVCKLHHAMVDGVSVVELGLVLFDDGPRARPLPARWEPAPAPGRLRLALEAARANAAWAVRAARSSAALVLRPRRSAGEALATARRVSAALDQDLLRPAPPSPLNAPIGPQRALIRHAEPLRPLLEARQRARVTLNDVCLAVVAGALGELLRGRGEACTPLKAMVPVSVRGEGELADAGNRISFAFVDLPLDERSSARRLARVHEQTEAFKRAGRPAGFGAVLQAAGFLPELARGAMARVVGSARVFNLAVSNIPGPREPVCMLGAELEEAYPVVPLADDHALSIGMFTYCDRIFFGIYADPGVLPEAGQLPYELRRAVDGLRQLRPARPRQRHLASV
jgi:WS/DGAT/MGAT family acyltransferase